MFQDTPSFTFRSNFKQSLPTWRPTSTELEPNRNLNGTRTHNCDFTSNAIKFMSKKEKKIFCIRIKKEPILHNVTKVSIYYRHPTRVPAVALSTANGRRVRTAPVLLVLLFIRFISILDIYCPKWQYSTKIIKI